MADELTGLLGGVINPDDLKRIMAMFQPTEDDKNAALKQALMTSGLRMLAARKGFEGVAAADAGLMGMQAYQQGMSGLQDAKLKQYKIGSELQKMAGDQKYSAGLAQQFNGNPALQAMGPGGPTPANAAAVESVNPQVAKYRAAAQYAAQNGRVKEAETYSNIADKLEEEFSTTPQPVRGADGAVQLAQFGKRGGVKVAQGLTPAEKLQFVNTGGLAGVGIEPYSGKQVSAGLPVTMDPAQQDASKRGWAGLNQAESHFNRSQANTQGNNVRSATADLRKEFNSLEPVKAFGQVMPALQSAREATGQDTAAADLNIIYAAAKIFDPTSVVRESETTMVMNSGSPAQRFAGQFNYVAGGGRLTPEARKQLMQQIESRARGYEAPYKSARKTYEAVALKNGVDPKDVFVEPSVSSEKQTGQITKQVVRTGTEKGTGRKVVQYSDGSTGYQ